jgi:hypothetical protein
MTVVDFYKDLSKILTDARERFLSKRDAQIKLDLLLEKAHESNLEVDISENILDENFLTKLDDERSYDDSNASYEDDESSY